MAVKASTFWILFFNFPRYDLPHSFDYVPYCRRTEIRVNSKQLPSNTVLEQSARLVDLLGAVIGTCIVLGVEGDYCTVNKLCQ